MKCCLRLSFYFYVALAVLCLGTVRLSADEAVKNTVANKSIAATEVTIERTDGWKLSGVVDAKSDDKTFWLRTASPSIVLLTGVEWKKIQSVQLAEKRLTVAEFQKLVPKLKTKIAEEDLPFSGVLEESKREVQENDVPLPPLPQGESTAIRPRNELRNFQVERVASLYIEATVANWDNDVESDGVQIVVVPISRTGRVVPINGFLDVRLFGRTIAQGGRHHPGPFRMRRHYPEIIRWGQKVHDYDFGPDGAVYNLPFRSIHPEFELNLAIDALVNARLNVPGQGVFEASDANIRLRPYSRFRDFHRQSTGSRFLREELTRPPQH